jgi:hypothetical protein
MTTATKPTPKLKVKALLDLPVKFGTVSLGVNKASFSIAIDRDSIGDEDAIRHLCHRRLTGWILLDSKDHPDQGSLPGMDIQPKRLSGVFDTNSVKFTPGEVGCTLNMAIKEIDVGDLAGFANRRGRLVISQSMEREDQAAGGQEGDRGGEGEGE